MDAERQASGAANGWSDAGAEAIGGRLQAMVRRPSDGVPPLLHFVVRVTESETLLSNVVPATEPGGMSGAEDIFVPNETVGVELRLEIFERLHLSRQYPSLTKDDVSV